MPTNVHCGSRTTHPTGTGLPLNVPGDRPFFARGSALFTSGLTFWPGLVPAAHPTGRRSRRAAHHGSARGKQPAEHVAEYAALVAVAADPPASLDRQPTGVVKTGVITRWPWTSQRRLTLSSRHDSRQKTRKGGIIRQTPAETRLKSTSTIKSIKTG